MQALPAFVPLHAGDSSQIVGKLLEIQTATPIYWVDFDLPITILSHTWLPRPFKVNGLTTSQGEVQQVSVEVADADGFLAHQDLGGASLVGVRVIIRGVSLNADLSVQGTIVLHDGQIDTPTYTESVATLALRGPVRLAGRQFPVMVCGPSCPFVFAGPLCGYNLSYGATSCNHSYADCQAKNFTGGVANGLSQHTRYGGMRNIPSPGAKVILGDGVFRLG